MKKRLTSVFLAITLLILPHFVNAASGCSYKEQAELNDIVSNIKASYEATKEKTETYPDPDDIEATIDVYEPRVEIKILNLTDDVYIKVINGNSKEENLYYNKDAKDGVITIKQNDLSTLNTYTIEVYSDKYACRGELFRKIEVTTPIYNSYSELEACNKNPDFYYCQEFITSKNISYDEFYKNLAKYENNEKPEEIKEEEKSFFEKIKEFYQNNKIVINVVLTIVIVGGVATTVILVKKRRSRVL